MATDGGIDHAQLIEQDSAALLAAAQRGPLDGPVHACPGWDVARVCGHLGWVHRWATLVVRTGTEPDRDAVPKPPRDREEAVAFFAAGVAPLVDAVASTDPERPAWNRWDEPAVTWFWGRRQAVETALHRWDVEAAVGDPAPLDTTLAVAGIDELLDVHLPYAGRHGVVPFTGSLHLHATDADGEWTVVGAGEEGVRAERGHAKGDAAVRGPASDLLLMLWRRIDPDHPALTSFGEEGVVRSWLAAGIP